MVKHFSVWWTNITTLVHGMFTTSCQIWKETHACFCQLTIFRERSRFQGFDDLGLLWEEGQWQGKRKGRLQTRMASTLASGLGYIMFPNEAEPWINCKPNLSLLSMKKQEETRRSKQDTASIGIVESYFSIITVTKKNKQTLLKSTATLLVDQCSWISVGFSCMSPREVKHVCTEKSESDNRL